MIAECSLQSAVHMCMNLRVHMSHVRRQSGGALGGGDGITPAIGYRSGTVLYRSTREGRCRLRATKMAAAVAATSPARPTHSAHRCSLRDFHRPRPKWLRCLGRGNVTRVRVRVRVGVRVGFGVWVWVWVWG